MNGVDDPPANPTSLGNVWIGEIRPSTEALAHLHQLAEFRTSIAIWRKQPPSVDDVRACSWWWSWEPAVTAPHVLHLDVEEGQIVYADDGDMFNADLWGGMWAPCLPPPDPRGKP